MTSPHPPAFKKLCAALVAVTLAFQPLAAYAALTDLAEEPLKGANPVRPNIMFTLDDSLSMNDEYLPDYVGESFSPAITHCRFTNPFLKVPCGNPPFPATGAFRQSDPPIRSSAYNGQFYDPAATWTPGKRADGTDLPCAGANVACTSPWTSVYVNGFAGYPGANTGATANLETGYPDTAWCNTQAAAPPNAADLATAFDDGSKCRLNGRSYAKYNEPSNLWSAPAVAAGYNYPNVKIVATGANTACGSVNEYCIFDRSAAVTGNPYYYTISKVQFCSNQEAGGGFGTPPCQDRWDKATFKYVRYGTDPAKAFDPQAFTRVDIKPTGFLVNGVAAANPSGRSYAQEMTNFARWYAFYRTRMLAMKTAGGKAFSALSDANANVGFHTLWENASATAGFLNIAPFTAANKATWFGNFYAVTPVGTTPLPDAAYRIGEYFSGRGAAAGLANATNPLADEDIAKCQRNYHLLSTDGYWNIALSPGNDVGNQDRTVPGSLPGPIPEFTSGNSFPRPYYEGAAVSSNSLADLAMHYWITDISPAADNVQDPVAPWQHVTLYGLSIGAQGSVDAAGLAAITAGTKDWPQPLGTGGPDSIDDLWHAALNSRGKYFNAANPQQLAESIVSALTDFTGPDGTGTAIGTPAAQVTAAKNFGYLTSYDYQLSGDVKKYALDTKTGALPADADGNPINPPVWSASDQLDAQVLDTGWDTNRRIVTINDSSGAAVPFRIASLSAAQQASLNAGWSVVEPTPTAQKVLDYLRGDKSNEGVGTTNFRVRAHALGDIVYSAAVPVGAPGQPYVDTQPGYKDFATAKSGRTPMVYVGANDGMVHAFHDSSVAADAGKEAWAFVPKALFSADDPMRREDPELPPSDFQLGALSYRPSGIPVFERRFYVNATPRIWDVDFANTNTKVAPQAGNDWRTLLVGGLGAGARAVYALDVTTPVPLNATEADVASSGRVLWEFTDANLGYVYDAPTLVKTVRYGWVALVASGYNNPGGEGILYVLNPTNGSILKKLSTGVGSNGDPSGLSTIRAFTSSRKDPYVLQAYGGDLKGNVWRFDLADADEANWKVELIAKLKDKDGNDQPITTGVRIEIDQNNNVDRYIFVGTGQLLGLKDIKDTSVTNTLYVIRDGTRTTAGAAPATPYSRADLDVVDGTKVAGISGAATGRGWYQDATDKTQKIATDVFADVQTVVFAFSRPQADPCLGILASTLYARDYSTGNSVLESAGGAVIPAADVGTGVAGIALIQGEEGKVFLRATLFEPSPALGGQVVSFGVRLTGGPSMRHRVSWRMINRD